MSEPELVIEHGNEVFHVEVRGFDHIPEPERNMSLRHVDYLWVGTSVNLLSFALGALTITLGLNLWLGFVACILGSIAYAYIGIGSIVTVRAGLPVSTLARAAFGMRGNGLNALLSWIASVAFEVINTIFGVEAVLAFFRLCGWSDPGSTGKLLAVLLQLVMCGGIAVLGHATMIWFQRIFSALIGFALLLVLAFTVARVDWAHASIARVPMAGQSSLAVLMAATAVVASNPLSFLFNGPDWVRYLPRRTSGRAIFRHVFWASFLPSVLLCLMGAYCATLGDVADPVAGLKPFVPGWLFVIYIAAVIGGSLANSVPTYYSSGLTLQALGLRVHRYIATAADVIASTLITLYILFVKDFTATLNDFVSLLIVWVGPYGGVWIADAYLRRCRYDAAAIHASRRAGPYWGLHGVNPAGFIALIVGMVLAALSMTSPLYEGPLARTLGGADLSWLLGFPVSASLYLLLSVALERRRADETRSCGPMPRRATCSTRRSSSV
ncbi:MAG TPA: cytosine permease [Steroidobacteraceae bacterium]|nr:cytosine permease [Steroidobacteraceae bacterium]